MTARSRRRSSLGCSTWSASGPGIPRKRSSIDLDLEADLGIDSIKRVEMLGALAESIEAGADGTPPNLEMEKLSVIKTLRGIADYVAEALSAAPQPSANGSHEDSMPRHRRTASCTPGARQGEVQRLVVRLIDAPLPCGRASRRRPGPSSSPTTARAPRGNSPTGSANSTSRPCWSAWPTASRTTTSPADLTDPAAVADLLARIRAKCGPVSGLIHLLPLAEPPEGETRANGGCGAR